MGDLAARLLLGGAGLLVVVAVVVAARAMERRRAGALVDVSALAGTVMFFSDRACMRCAAVRDLLDEEGVDYVEYGYEDDPAVHRAAGVVAVPLVVIRTDGSQPPAVLAGVPSARRLHRALAAIG